MISLKPIIYVLPSTSYSGGVYYYSEEMKGQNGKKYYSEDLIAEIKKKIYEQGKDGNVDDIWMGINSALAKAIFIIDEVLKDE